VSTNDLVVLAVGLSLGIENTRPVVGFKIGLVVNIDLNLNICSLRLNWVDGDTSWVKKASDKSSDTRWAPLSNNFSGLEAELGSKDGVLDCAIIIDLAEREGLVDGGALVSKGVDSSLGVNGNADGKTTGNTRGGGTRAGEVGGFDAWDVHELFFASGLGIELGGAGHL